MSRGKQSVRKDVWYIGEKRKKKKKQRGKSFPIGLLASVGVPIFSELAKPIAKKIFGCGKKTRRRK